MLILLAVGDVLACMAVRNYVSDHPDEHGVAALLRPYIIFIALAEPSPSILPHPTPPQRSIIFIALAESALTILGSHFVDRSVVNTSHHRWLRFWLFFRRHPWIPHRLSLIDWDWRQKWKSGWDWHQKWKIGWDWRQKWKSNGYQRSGESDLAHHILVEAAGRVNSE